MEYYLVEWDDDTDAGRVNELIAKGWRPQGGVAACSWNDRDGYSYTRYTQAMVRERSPEPELVAVTAMEA